MSAMRKITERQTSEISTAENTNFGIETNF